MLHPSENTLTKLREKKTRRTWSLADLQTQVDALSPSIMVYPYVGKFWQANILSSFSDAELAAATVKCGKIAYYYPDVKPLLSDQEKVFHTDRPRFWREVWKGSLKNEPYCSMVEEHWREILEHPQYHRFSYADFTDLPVYLPQPGDFTRQERIFIGTFRYWLKFEDENNGLTVIDDQAFVTTALLRDHATGEIFALLARPFDTHFVLSSPAACIQGIKDLPPSMIKKQKFT